VTPEGQAATSEFRRLFLVHEVFHCFQFDILGAEAWTGRPAWITEGTADWVALTVDPVDYRPGRDDRDDGRQ
jgi:Peptidase of plants and bacteria